MNEHASILVYKQTILPIFDYSGFLLISITNGIKHDLQIMQNDALRFCKCLNLRDMVSIPILHNTSIIQAYTVFKRKYPDYTRNITC